MEAELDLSYSDLKKSIEFKGLGALDFVKKEEPKLFRAYRITNVVIEDGEVTLVMTGYGISRIVLSLGPQLSKLNMQHLITGLCNHNFRVEPSNHRSYLPEHVFEGKYAVQIGTKQLLFSNKDT